MSDLLLRAYKAAIAMEPVALLDYYVKIITYKALHYRQVDFYESIPPFQVLNIGAIAAQITSARTNAVNLDLKGDEFGQWRWFPLDNFMGRLFNPAGVAKHQLKFLQVGVDQNIIYRDPTLLTTEFNTWEDERPAFEAMNFSDYALGAARIIVIGYRYHTIKLDADTEAKIKNGTIPCTTIQCAGRP